MGAAIGIGFTLGQPVGGLLAGKDAASANFVAPAVVSCALSLLAILLVRFVLPESHTAEHRARHPQAPRRSPWRLLRERPAFAHLAAATLAVTFSQAILESIFAIWAWHRYGFGPRAVGFLLFAVALPALIMQGGVVRLLVPRLGEVRLATAGVLTYVAGLIALGTGASFAVTVAGLLLCGAGLGRLQPERFRTRLAPIARTRPRRGDRAPTPPAPVSPACSGRSPPAPCMRSWVPAGPFLIGACVTLPAAWLVRRARAAPD